MSLRCRVSIGPTLSRTCMSNLESNFNPTLSYGGRGTVFAALRFRSANVFQEGPTRTEYSRVEKSLPLRPPCPPLTGRSPECILRGCAWSRIGARHALSPVPLHEYR